MFKPTTFSAPPLRVSRPISACSRCRTAKIKCDGKLPSCSACEKSGRAAECSSANDRFARGKERNYVASLEVCVEKLERQLEEARGRKISVTMLDLDPKASATARPISKKPKAERKEASHVDDLVSDFGFLSVNATARDFNGFTRQMSFARLVLYTSTLEEMPQPTALPLPPRLILTSLIQIYIDRVVLLYPFLSETAIFSFLAEHQGNHNITPMAHWTVRFVLAIALASRSRRRGDQDYVEAVGHAAEAFHVVEAVVIPGSVEGIQALLLLVFYAMLDPHHFNSWYLIGIASRVMVDLGLHQDPSSNTPVPKPHLDFRRRIYQSVYCLDRAITLVHRRAFSFTDDSANVRPEPPSGEQTVSYGLEPAQQLLGIRQLQSAAYQQLHLSNHSVLEHPWSVVSTSLNEMRSWAEHLPDRMDQSLKMLLLSESSYGCILVLCAPSVAQDSSDYVSAMTFEYALQYTGSMSSLLQMKEHSVLYTSHDVLRASYVGDKLLDALGVLESHALDGTSLPPPHLSSDVSTLPLFSRRNRAELIAEALSCLEGLDEVLKHLCVQYGYPEPLNEYRQRSLGLSKILHLRRGVYHMPVQHDHRYQASSAHERSGTRHASARRIWET